MQTKELVKTKEEKVTDTPKTRYFKTLFSSSITDTSEEWFSANTLGQWIDENFVKAGIYKKYPKTTWIGKTVEIPESECPIKGNQLN